MAKSCLPLAAVCTMVCACSSIDVVGPEGETPQGDVSIQVSVPGWDDISTRAGGEMLYPISVLVAPEGSDDITKTLTVESGTSFYVSLPNGNYDIFAVCGLEPTLIKSRLSAYIKVPMGTDFAAGQTRATVKNGVCTPSVVNITADRQMAWLDLLVTGVPENIQSLDVYIRGLYENYTVEGGWKITPSHENRFTKIPVAKGANGYEGSLLSVPCSDASGVTYVVEATTTSGYTTLLSYTSSQPLGAGEHLTQKLEYSNLMVVDGGIDIGGWNDTSDNGSLSDNYGLAVGDQYLSLPATIISYNTTTNYLNLLAHKPMTTTLNAEFKASLGNLSYGLAPEVNVQRWIFPGTEKAASTVFSVISQIGWSALDAQFTASGSTPIDRSATNILAYYDAANDVFYRYNFQELTIVPVSDTSGEFLVYPQGKKRMAE